MIYIIKIFRGLCEAVVYNPKGIVDFLVFFCDAICLFDKAPDTLEKLFQDIIYSFTVSLEDSFFKAAKGFPQALRNKLVNRFNVKI